MTRRFFYACAGLLCLALAYHFGARNAGAQATGQSGEVAVNTGTLSDRQMIPLPHYPDGSEAVESECRWIVSPHDLEFDQNIQHLHCSSDHRLVRVYICHPTSGDTDNCANFHGTGGTADYMIVAVRNLVPTPTQRSSFGQLKVRYR